MGRARHAPPGSGRVLTVHAADGVIAEVQAELGRDADPPADLLDRVTRARGPDGFALLAAPRDASAVAAVLAACTRAEWPVAALGAGTWPLAGRSTSASNRPPVLLSTVRLDQIVEHEPADLVVGVQAGMPLHRLNAELGAARQWLPLDPPGPARASVGATAALAAAGPLRAGHGTPRDLVLGVEIATGDGRLIRFGGRVVKNVAGYDGVRLAIGSAGRLGVITSLFLKVSGAPRSELTLAAGCGAEGRGARRAVELALEVRNRVQCDALEVLAPGLAAEVGMAREWTMLVRLLGNQAAVAESAARVRDAESGSGGGAVREPGDAVWSRLAHTESYAMCVSRLTVPLEELGRGLEDAAGGAAGTGGAMVAAHVTEGVIRVWATDPAPAQGVERAAGLGRERGWLVREDRVVTAVAAESKEAGSEVWASGAGAGRERIANALRAAFDPGGILLGPDWGD